MLHNTLKTFLKMRKDNGEKGGSNMNNQQMMELTTVEKSEFEQLYLNVPAPVQLIPICILNTTLREVCVTVTVTVCLPV